MKKSSSKFYLPSDDIQEEDVNTLSECHALEQSLPAISSRTGKPFVPSHRKSRSLGSNALLESLSAMAVKAGELSEKPSSSRKTSIQSCLENDCSRTRRLIDDSVMEEETDECSDSGRTPPRRTSVDFSIGDGRLVAREMGSGCRLQSQKADSVPLIRIIENPVLGEKKERRNVMPQSETGILFEGCVKRKTILKDGKKPAFSVWVRYWLILRSNRVLYFHPAKSVQGCTKDKFRKRNNKSTLITSGWLALAALNEEDSFTLADETRRNIYLFKTNGSEEAALWCQSLSGLDHSFIADSSSSGGTGAVNCRNRSLTTSPCLKFAI